MILEPHHVLLLIFVLGALTAGFFVWRVWRPAPAPAGRVPTRFDPSSRVDSPATEEDGERDETDSTETESHTRRRWIAVVMVVVGIVLATAITLVWGGAAFSNYVWPSLAAWFGDQATLVLVGLTAAAVLIAGILIARVFRDPAKTSYWQAAAALSAAVILVGSTFSLWPIITSSSWWNFGQPTTVVEEVDRDVAITTPDQVALVPPQLLYPFCANRKMEHFFGTTPVQVNPAGECAIDLWTYGHCVYVMVASSSAMQGPLCDGGLPDDVEWVWTADTPFTGHIRLPPPRYN